MGIKEVMTCPNRAIKDSSKNDLIIKRCQLILETHRTQNQRRDIVHRLPRDCSLCSLNRHVVPHIEKQLPYTQNLAKVLHTLNQAASVDEDYRWPGVAIVGGRETTVNQLTSPMLQLSWSYWLNQTKKVAMVMNLKSTLLLTYYIKGL